MIINIQVNSILLFWLSHLKTLIYMSDYIDKNPDTYILLFKFYKHLKQVIYFTFNDLIRIKKNLNCYITNICSLL
jgi:hypothetical protein